MKNKAEGNALEFISVQAFSLMVWIDTTAVIAHDAHTGRARTKR